MRFHEYLTNLRLSNAVRLIENGFLSVKEIAHMSAFLDAQYFSKVFTRKNGMSPSEMIKKYGKKKAADFDFGRSFWEVSRFAMTNLKTGRACAQGKLLPVFGECVCL